MGHNRDNYFKPNDFRNSFQEKRVLCEMVLWREQGKHREVRTKGNGFGVRKEAGKQKVKENLLEELTEKD